MTIFIPVLWICLNGHCEFMQQTRHFTDEEACKEAVRVQKQKLRDMAAETGETITQLEGTCIDFFHAQAISHCIWFVYIYLPG